MATWLSKQGSQAVGAPQTKEINSSGCLKKKKTNKVDNFRLQKEEEKKGTRQGCVAVKMFGGGERDTFDSRAVMKERHKMFCRGIQT